MEAQVNDAEQLWNRAVRLLRDQVSEVVWLSTFQGAEAVELAGNRLVVAVPSTHARDRINGPYLALVRDALTEAGHGDVELVLSVRPDWTEEPFPRETDTPLVPVPTNGEQRSAAAEALISRLNERYTFETFVKGQSNQFALAAALRVAETPGRSYNPLFIYGAAGLGKTHLLHAIAHYVQQNYGHYQVRYVSTETFLNEYVDAIRTSSTPAFKRRYREIDVLLVDDIQFMEGKEGLQEEFFHTFNSLHGAGKQIVISSDRTPDNIPTLEERLRGRFKWGLITDIQPPDLETRLAILRNKAERDHSLVPPEVLEFIASRVTNNIRELEGALIRVSAYASLNRATLDVALAQQLLTDMLSGNQPRPLTPAVMLETISEFFGFSVEALRGKSRQRPLVTARQVAMYVFRELTDLSYPAIGREFGNRDHTTVIHAVEKVQALMKERQQIYSQVTELIQLLKAPA